MKLHVKDSHRLPNDIGCQSKQVLVPLTRPSLSRFFSCQTMPLKTMFHKIADAFERGEFQIKFIALEPPHQV